MKGGWKETRGVQRSISAENPLVVPPEAFDVAQMKVAKAKAPHLLFVRQCHQPVRDQLILVAQPRLIPIAGLADAERPAGKPDAG